MQNQFFCTKQRGILLATLLLTMGFCVQAQQSTTTQPSATIIYASQLSQMSPEKQAYIKSHSQEFIIKADPIQGASPVKSSETFTTPDGQVFPGKAPAAMLNRPSLVKPTQVVAQPSQVPPSGKVSTIPTTGVVQKTKVSSAELNRMDAEKRAFIQAHPDQFEMVD